MSKRENSTIGKRLKTLRKMMQLTQPEFAKLCGVPAATYSLAERQKEIIASRVALSVAKVTGASLDWLFLGRGDEDMLAYLCEEKKSPDDLKRIMKQIKKGLWQDFHIDETEEKEEDDVDNFNK